MTISKFEGLQKLEAFDLPRPDWRFVTLFSDLPKEPWSRALFGWTIRCVPYGNYKFSLPSIHRLEFEMIESHIANLKDKLKMANFVIYPSWKFDKSGCCLVRIERIIIEVVVGDIGPLLSGKISPASTYTFNGPYYARLNSVTGTEDILSKHERAYLVKHCRKIKPNNEVVLEWTKTSEGIILFHDWIES